MTKDLSKLAGWAEDLICNSVAVINGVSTPHLNAMSG
jgi:hypothetical protein